MEVFTSRYIKKWADLVIVGEHFEGPGRMGRIVSYDVRPDLGDRLGAEVNMTFNEVLIAWLAGNSMCTAVLRDGKWWYGAPVIPELRTVPDGNPSNNLNNLS